MPGIWLQSVAWLLNGKNGSGIDDQLVNRLATALADGEDVDGDLPLPASQAHQALSSKIMQPRPCVPQKGGAALTSPAKAPAAAAAQAATPAVATVPKDNADEEDEEEEDEEESED